VMTTGPVSAPCGFMSTAAVRMGCGTPPNEVGMGCGTPPATPTVRSSAATVGGARCETSCESSACASRPRT
jgi:hypothetical protein